METVETIEQPPVEKTTDQNYQEESPVESSNRGIGAVKIILIALLIIAIGGIIYAASVHVKASKQHLKNEQRLAEKLEKGELQIKTK
jgi:flagellar basal body-associated protein FliL